MAPLEEVRPDMPSPVSLWRWVLGAAAGCFLCASWSFTRAVNSTLLVDVTPGRTLTPLLLFVVIAFVGRGHVMRARRVLALSAAVIMILTAVAMPVVVNQAIDAGHPAGAWPMDWLVPVQLHFRTY